MAVLYLEPEDEITGAVARLRAMSDTQVVLVVPSGSRIGTSRINFRLLAREAGRRRLRLATVSDDPPARAMAASAGLPAYESVDAAESAMAAEGAAVAEPATDGPAGDERAAGQPAGEGLAAKGPATTDQRATERPATEQSEPTERRRRGSRADDTRLLRVPPVPADERRVRAPPAVEPPLYDPAEVRPRRRRRRRSLILPLFAAVLLMTLVALGAYAAYLFVPTAEITLRPRLVEVGPVSVTVVADPSVAVVDTSAALIPAQRIEIPISTEGEFPATGTLVTTTHATGTVRFRSENTLFEVPIPAGTVVATRDGAEFQTTAAVTVPKAVFNQQAGTVNANVRAVRAGPRGNVASGAITVLPESFRAALVSVRNPQAISGGRRVEQTVATQEDYDDALAELSRLLQPRLSAALSDPANVPRGLTLYRASARLGQPAPDVLADAVVDVPGETFALSVAAIASVLAVNEALVDDVAAAHLRRRVPAGATLLEPTLTTTHPPGVVRGEVIEFSASGVARSYRQPGRDELLAEIRGQPVSEARAIMERYGTAEIVIWPDFIDRVPDQLARINLVVQPPAETP